MILIGPLQIVAKVCGEAFAFARPMAVWSVAIAILAPLVSPIGPTRSSRIVRWVPMGIWITLGFLCFLYVRGG